LACLVSVLGTGCPSPQQYHPSDRLVRELGEAQARQQLDEVLSRAVNPHITDVEITDKFLRYRFQQTIVGAFYQVSTTLSENRITFANINRVEIYDSHLVFVWHNNRSLMAQIVFASDEDAKLFADLIESFRAQSPR